MGPLCGRDQAMVHIRSSGIFSCTPADPATFAAWLAAAGAQDRGYAQTKTRCVAISALCALVGAPSPEAHHLVRAYRTAARRNKRFRRGSVTPLFRSELPLPPTESQQGAPQLARRAGLSPDERLRQRAATARHMALMHDAALRFDDTREGQLGNILQTYTPPMWLKSTSSGPR